MDWAWDGFDKDIVMGDPRDAAPEASWGASHGERSCRSPKPLKGIETHAVKQVHLLAKAVLQITQTPERD